MVRFLCHPIVGSTLKSGPDGVTYSLVSARRLQVYVDLYTAFLSKAPQTLSDIDHTVLPAFTPQPQSITALWLVHIYRPTEGRRPSRPGWLVTYRNKVPPPGVEPGHGHPSQY